MIAIKHKQSNISNILKEYPKSAWNTLDFEPGQGPLAYNRTQNYNNNLA